MCLLFSAVLLDALLNLMLQHEGGTALMFASMNGHKEMVELLLEKGADVKAKNVRASLVCCIVGCSAHLDVAEQGKCSADMGIKQWAQGSGWGAAGEGS